jgi:hypothetical protein
MMPASAGGRGLVGSEILAVRFAVHYGELWEGLVMEDRTRQGRF